MKIVCLWSPRWATAAAPLADLVPELLRVAPRVVVEARGVVWADGRGLPGARVAWSLLEAAGGQGQEVRAGVADVPIAAEAAARTGGSPVTIVEPARERHFLAPLPLDVLGPAARLRALRAGVGIQTCGELAKLPRESVEVRFGAAGAALWRLATADDPRPLFRPIPRERPHASVDFLEYEVRDAGRLAFAVNALLGPVCAQLAERGERARDLNLSLALSGGGALQERIRVARPTAERGVWLRRIRSRLDRLALPDGVSGVALEVEGIEGATGSQGDLFDPGFASAGAVEEVVARLVDEHGPLYVEPVVSAHPLPERRTVWRDLAPETAAGRGGSQADLRPSLALQLLPEPRQVAVRARPRRDHVVPVEYCDVARGREWRRLLVAAGPERISGGAWDRPYAREYFQCLTDAGVLLWLFRDAAGTWFVHGWWD